MAKAQKIGPPFKLSSRQELEVVHLHEEGVSNAEMATRFDCSEGTVLRILHRHSALKPRNATAREKAAIRRLSGRRTAKQIATFLGRSPSFVEVWQKRQGFRAHPKIDAALETRICKRYLSDPNYVRVAKQTNVNEKVVRTVLLRAGVKLHPGQRPMLTPEKRRRATAMILARNTYLKDIAKKLGVHRDCIEQLAHLVLGIERFFGGPLWPPLQSAFPEIQTHDERSAIGWYMELLGRIFPAGLPPEPDYVVVPAVISMLLETFPFWRSASVSVLRNLEAQLVTAAATMRSAEQAVVH